MTVESGRIIWLMTTQVIRCCDLFRAYYQKRRKDGLPHKKAVLPQLKS